MYKIDNLPYNLTIGKTGENSARTFLIDCRSWLRNFRGGQMSLLFMTPTGTKKRTALQDENYIVSWTPTAEELAVAGTGYMELQLIYNGVVAKSKTVEVKIEKSVEDFDAPYLPPSPSGYYIKPIGGIPASDLAEEVQDALAAAEAAQPLIDDENKLPYSLLSGTPEIPDEVTEETVAGWGFTQSAGGLKPTYYYEDLTDAIADINAVFTLKKDVDAADGTVRVDVRADGGLTVTLMDDQLVSSSLRPVTSMTIDLSGHSITCTASALINLRTSDPVDITIDGRITGSGITVTNSDSEQVLLAQLIYTGAASASFTLLGGLYNVTGAHTLTCAIRAQGCEVKIVDCEITINASGSDANPGVIGMWLQSGSRGDAKNSTVYAEYNGTGNARTYGIYNHDCKLDAASCTVNANAPYNSDRCFSTVGIECTAGATTKITNCTVTGLHSGIRNSGELDVDYGTYQSKGHGGIYFSGTQISRVKNATLREGSYTGLAQIPNSSFNGAAFYIGSALDANPIVYIDNCELEASSNTQFYCIRQMTIDAKLYISNCTIPSGKMFRIDQFPPPESEEGEKNNIVHVGVGCNITPNNVLLRTGTVEIDGATFSLVTVAEEDIYTPTEREILIVNPLVIAEHLKCTNDAYGYSYDPAIADLRQEIQAALDGKAEADALPVPSDATPAALGTAGSAGSSSAYARGDHVHPKPTASDIGAVAVNQGAASAGKFAVVGNDGNIAFVTLAAWQGGNY